jgi:Zn-finger nucleic acid-binding protein
LQPKQDVMPADAAGLSCPNCGAPARTGGDRCDYCLARLATVSCPSCFGLIVDGAAFCTHCGARRDRAESAPANRTACPACRGDMSWVRVGETDLLECGRCAGTWVEAAVFEALCTSRESQAALLHTRPAAAATPPAQPVRYRPCPRCGKLMNRVNFARQSGAIVDVCKGHGTFLDRGELHQIAAFIQGGGVDRARAAERAALADEQRRLRDLQRDQLRRTADSSTARWNDTSLRDLFSALFDRI